ncbi:MAG: DUF4870 domain-containing protein [Candidatus Woesearchaeota archaeon]
MGQNDKLVSALSYILVGIIWYFADAKVQNTTTRFHVKQGLNLLIISLVGHFILGIIPILGWIILPFFSLAIFILWIIGLVNALNGKQNEIPLIGVLADKYLKF